MANIFVRQLVLMNLSHDIVSFVWFLTNENSHRKFQQLNQDLANKNNNEIGATGVGGIRLNSFAPNELDSIWMIIRIFHR